MKNLTKFFAAALLTLTFAFTNVDKKVVVIDVSHGGHDSGTTINGFNEKEIALNIARKIKGLNTNANIEIILTRDDDEFLSLKDRAAQINKLQPDMVISLHANSTDNEKTNGKEIFISDLNSQKEKSGHLAMKLFQNFNDRNVKIEKADFYLLKKVEYPVALVELGYLSNQNDFENLTSEKGQIELAVSILKSLE